MVLSDNPAVGLTWLKREWNVAIEMIKKLVLNLKSEKYKVFFPGRQMLASVGAFINPRYHFHQVALSGWKMIEAIDYFGCFTNCLTVFKIQRNSKKQVLNYSWKMRNLPGLNDGSGLWRMQI